MSGYVLPSEEVVNIVDDAFKPPSISLSSDRKYLSFLSLPPLKTIEEIAAEEVKLGGLRLSRFFTKSLARISWYSSLSVLALPANDKPLPAKLEQLHEQQKKVIIPENTEAREMLGYAAWNRSSERLAICKLTTEGTGGLGLIICDRKSGKTFPVDLELPLNAVFGTPFKWINDTQIICQLATNAGAPPPKESRIPSGPHIQQHASNTKSQARTYQDLLSTEYDDSLFRYYAESTLVLVTLQYKNNKLQYETKPLNLTAMITGLSISPSQKYVKVKKLGGEFSRIVPYHRFENECIVYEFVENKKLVLVNTIAHLPVAETIPLAHDSCRQGRRCTFWSEGHQHTICCVEALDGGDPDKEVEFRDRLFSLSASDGFKSETEIAKIKMRWSGLDFFEDGETALLYEASWRTKKTKRWLLKLENAGGIPKVKSQTLLVEYSSENRYEFPGNFSTAISNIGTRSPMVLGRKKDLLLLNNTIGASDKGNIPWLDLYSMEGKQDGVIKTGTTRRIWTSDHDSKKYQRIVAALQCNPKSAHHPQSFIRVLIAEESTEEPTNYFCSDLQYEAALTSKGDKLQHSTGWTRITNYPHPYPLLKGYTKEIIKYKREDDVDLNGTLYYPPNYDRSKQYPLLLWAYPREFKTKESAGQIRDSPFRFSRVRPLSPLIWLVAGYVVLEGPAMPVIPKDGDPRTANDTYVTQLVQSARAAVTHVCREMKVCDPKRVAVGGHSYGAFMTANLLIHAPDLFACGIARSGAYNRTWTPFGFQAEERTLWEASSVYYAMSPFMNVHSKIKPLLLIHGEEDENSGTYPEQSKRMYAALRGNGVVCRLCVLPKEGHGYKARESILHCLAETEEWLKLYAGK